MYCLYVRLHYTYIDINALAQEIKSFLVPQVWFQAVAGGWTYGTRLAHNYQSVTLTICMYVCMYVCKCVSVCVYVCVCVLYWHVILNVNNHILKLKQLLVFRLFI